MDKEAVRYLSKSLFLAAQRRADRLAYRLFGSKRQNPDDPSVILAYHTLCRREPVPVCLQGETARTIDFEEHLRQLLGAGYRLVTISELISQSQREKCAAITFDDGYASVYRYAYPLLQKYQAKATLFVTVGFLAGNTRPPWGIKDARLCRAFSRTASLWDPCTWDEIKEMAQSERMEIGSHSQTHRLLGRLAPEEALEEMIASRQTLEKHTGKKVTIFSYPFGVGRYGAYRAESASCLSQAGYLASCTGEEGTFRSSQDRYFLPRFPIRYGDQGIDVLCRITGQSLGGGSWQNLFHRTFSSAHDH